MNNMTMGQKIAVGGGVVLLVSSFLPWYSAFGISISAWDSGFLAWGGVLLGVVGAALIGMKAFGKNAASAGGLATEQLALVLTAAGTLLILLRLITESSLVSFGLFLGLLAAAVAAYGSFTATREQGLDVPGKRPGGPPPSGPPAP
ncbi:MAG: hypothetical protein ACLGHL_06720 [Actinomycetota bacterium]